MIEFAPENFNLEPVGLILNVDVFIHIKSKYLLKYTEIGALYFI